MGIRDDILSIEDRKKEAVEVPEWNMTVFVSEIGADARDELEQYLAFENKSNGKEHQYARVRGVLAAVSIVDDKGKSVFTIADAPALGQKNSNALDRIFEVSNRLNKIFGSEKEDIKKNSKETAED